MSKIILSFISVISFIFVAPFADANRFTLACPQANQLQFIQDGDHYRVMAFVRVVTNNEMPFVMEGETSTTQVEELNSAKYHPGFNGNFICHYNNVGHTGSLTLQKAEFSPILQSCYFQQWGEENCKGSIDACELHCEFS